jgi:hypothetical protein
MDRMSLAEYAYVHSLRGHNVKLVGSTYWLERRRFFYRPLVPYIPVESRRVVPPCGVGIYQYAVNDEVHANSTINFRVFDQCEAYSLDTQKREFRRVVRLAAKIFEVKPIGKEGELEEHGPKIYLSFYDRTKYRYLSERIQLESFRKWVETLFACPKTIVLGGYGDHGLSAVAVCYWIDDLLLYSTFFSDTASLKRHISDLMLHVVRQMAAQQKGVRCILAGMYSGGIGSDRFDLLRGGKVERKPARYVISPSVAGLFLRALSPAHFSRLSGNF